MLALADALIKEWIWNFSLQPEDWYTARGFPHSAVDWRWVVGWWSPHKCFSICHSSHQCLLPPPSLCFTAHKNLTLRLSDLPWKRTTVMLCMFSWSLPSFLCFFFLSSHLPFLWKRPPGWCYLFKGCRWLCLSEEWEQMMCQGPRMA